MINSCYSDPTLREVCNELENVSYKRFKIGIQLGIPHHTLKQFENETDPFVAAMDYWLKGNVKESGTVSWKSIVTALESTHVEEPALAEKINKKYCQQKSKVKKKAGLATE